jgi:hypothetical protein
MVELGHGDARSARVLADIFARDTRRRIGHLFHDLWHNDDSARYALGRAVLDGEYQWVERGTMGVPYSIQELVPATMKAIFAARAKEPAAAENHHDARETG